MKTNEQRKKHIGRHRELHFMLAELLADWIHHTKKLLSEHTIMEFLEWSYQQTVNPTERK